MQSLIEDDSPAINAALDDIQPLSEEEADPAFTDGILENLTRLREL